jgi:septal ring factor EnvC (AmiA/AmiB activator)
VLALIGTVASRKVRTPADELARADFAYKKIAERLEEVNKDRAYLQSVIDMLRTQLTKLDIDAIISLEDKRKLRNLIDEGELRIQRLIEENGELHTRLSSIAEKVRNGKVITLYDVYGSSTADVPAIENLDSVAPQKDLLQNLIEKQERS